MAVPSVLIRPVLTHDKNWYRGEGNLCLVLSNLPERKVYRFFKVLCNKNELDDGTSESADERLFAIHQVDTITRLQNAIDYVSYVIRPLLSDQFVPHMEIVELSKEFLSRASNEIEQLRPKSRLNKHVNIAEPYALSMCDMTLLPEGHGSDQQPTVTVEIKPKCGFIPGSVCTSGGGVRDTVRSQVCKYCLLQRYKVQLGKVSTVSSYCPLQLFSGNQRLVERAVSSLVDNPQNNLRLFKNGDLLDTVSGLHDILNTLDPHQRDVTKSKETFISLVGKVLLKPCPPALLTRADGSACTLLDKVLELQQLSTHDIRTIYQYYLTLEQYYAKHPNQRACDGLDGPFTGGQWLAAGDGVAPAGCDAAGGGSVRHIVTELKRFLVSQTVRDCQIMIALQPTTAVSCGDSDSVVECDGGRRYVYHIGVIDLDPKPYHKIPAYHRQQEAVLDAYLSAVTQPVTPSCAARATATPATPPSNISL